MSTRVIVPLLQISLIIIGARSAAAYEPLSGEGLLALCSTQDAAAVGAQKPDQFAGFSDDCIAVIQDATRMMRALKDGGNCFADVPNAVADEDLARTALFNAMAAAYPCTR